MKRLIEVLCLTAIAGSVQPAGAQVTLDVAKVTCDQWAGYKITNPQNIALWLSGYQHGRRGQTVLDTQGMNASTQKLRDFCIVNPEIPVMDAAERLFGPGK
jgi:acid stress chaperone HdeB